MKRQIITALTVGALVTASPLLAVAPARAPQQPALERAESRVGRLAEQTKGGPQHRLLMEKQKIHRLLEDLDAGRAVDPQEIDRALESAERPF